jgi:hypothetical protein
VHAAWFCASALSALARIKTIPVITTVVPLLATIYGGAYLVIAFRRAYGLTTAAALRKSIAVLFVYWIFVLAALMAIVFRFGVFDR